MRPTLVMLALVGLIITACQPTPAPGEPTWTPKPTRTVRPTATSVPATATVTPEPTLTLMPTPHLPTPGAYTRMDVPTEQVCQRSVRERLTEWEYANAFIRLDALLYRLEGTPEWLTDKDFRADLRAFRDRIEGLEVVPCTEYGHSFLMLEVTALEAAFDLYPERPAEAMTALANARTASTTYYYWAVGSLPWRPVPLH